MTKYPCAFGGRRRRVPRRRNRTTVDAQRRGRGEQMDPADQWVLNPNTGEYELRLTPSAAQSPVPGDAEPRGAVVPQLLVRRRPAGPPPVPEVPPQRRRRVAPEEPPPGRRGGRRPVQKKPNKAKKALLWTGGTHGVRRWSGPGSAGYIYLQHLEGNVSTTDVGSAGASNFKQGRGLQHPHHRHGQAHRRGQRGLRRQGQLRARGHHDPAARLRRTAPTRPRSASRAT